MNGRLKASLHRDGAPPASASHRASFPDEARSPVLRDECGLWRRRPSAASRVRTLIQRATWARRRCRGARRGGCRALRTARRAGQQRGEGRSGPDLGKQHADGGAARRSTRLGVLRGAARPIPTCAGGWRRHRQHRVDLGPGGRRRLPVYCRRRAASSPHPCMAVYSRAREHSHQRALPGLIDNTGDEIFKTLPEFLENWRKGIQRSGSAVRGDGRDRRVLASDEAVTATATIMARRRGVTLRPAADAGAARRPRFDRIPHSTQGRTVPHLTEATAKCSTTRDCSSQQRDPDDRRRHVLAVRDAHGQESKLFPVPSYMLLSYLCCFYRYPALLRQGWSRGQGGGDRDRSRAMAASSAT